VIATAFAPDPLNDRYPTALGHPNREAGRSVTIRNSRGLLLVLRGHFEIGCEPCPQLVAQCGCPRDLPFGANLVRNSRVYSQIFEPSTSIPSKQAAWRGAAAREEYPATASRVSRIRFPARIKSAAAMLCRSCCHENHGLDQQGDSFAARRQIQAFCRTVSGTGPAGERPTQADARGNGQGLGRLGPRGGQARRAPGRIAASPFFKKKPRRASGLVGTMKREAVWHSRNRPGVPRVDLVR